MMGKAKLLNNAQTFNFFNRDGRVHIPKKWRDQLGLEIDSLVEVKYKAGKFIIRPLTGEEAEEAEKHIRRRGKRASDS